MWILHTQTPDRAEAKLWTAAYDEYMDARVVHRSTNPQDQFWWAFGSLEDAQQAGRIFMRSTATTQ